MTFSIIKLNNIHLFKLLYPALHLLCLGGFSPKTIDETFGLVYFCLLVGICCPLYKKALLLVNQVMRVISLIDGELSKTDLPG